ncbi:hypothetical protein PR003_g18092 [Phytophthora rubi]|uniref:Pectate lyase n=1 Tax=Phytophthora rubi TaxID=129364 RepID=A0A6A3K3E9_9STRA|nr:hypothetical protein PR002_g18115 [Phytophthora rubi]KAE9006073.1 hypothetical protein PR001_g17293 [Phytophthora rubi]KAE9319024.1 hypothetical protein PR003_g18092 [Phytophthora rubi]
MSGVSNIGGTIVVVICLLMLTSTQCKVHYTGSSFAMSHFNSNKSITDHARELSILDDRQVHDPVQGCKVHFS